LSPILVRPVREQLEHDRVIRLLQAKYKRKFEVAINPGSEQNAPVLVGTSPWYPDLVLYSQERGRKLLGTVEVETAESVNNLEAMSQWKTFSQQRAPFHLYVPVSSIDTARRMATDLQIPVAEIWAYSAFGDQMRFTLVQRSAVSEAKARPAPPAEPKPRAAAPPAVPKPAVAVRPATSTPRAASSARAGSPNGRSRGAATAAPARAPRRSAAAPAKAHRKTASGGRGSAKTPAARRSAAKKTTSRTQKRK
jgi:hypothetical protein